MRLDQIEKYQISHSRIIILLLAIGLMLRLLLAYYSPITGDASEHLQRSLYFAKNMNLDSGWPYFWAPPLIHLVFGLVYKSLCFNELIARAAVLSITPLVSVASCYLFYLIFKKFTDKATATIFLAVILFFPASIYYGYIPFMDIHLLFFMSLATLLALEKRPVKSGLACAMGLLTKFQGIFIYPLLVTIYYLKKKDMHEFIKNLLLLGLFSIPGLIWYVRNYIELNNPIYHFLPEIFGGKYIEINKAVTVSTSFIGSLYDLILSAFTIPDPQLAELLIVKIVIVLYLLFFTIPTITYLKQLKFGFSEKIAILGFISFFAVEIIYALDQDTMMARFMLFGIFSMLFIWAKGYSKLMNSKNRSALILLLILFLGCFSAQNILISYEVKKTYEKWTPDIEEIKKTPDDSMILVLNRDSFSWWMTGRQSIVFLQDSTEKEMQRKSRIKFTAFFKDNYDKDEIDYVYYDYSQRNISYFNSDIERLGLDSKEYLIVYENTAEKTMLLEKIN